MRKKSLHSWKISHERRALQWMKSQVSRLYFQTYQMAYDLAKQAEKCYQHELVKFDTSFIEFGYWDSLKQGLLSGRNCTKT